MQRKNYTIIEYKDDIDKLGLEQTWHKILKKSLKNEFDSDLFIVDNFGELYEVGLEYVNKINKKEMGKYYTPRDVSRIMSKWLLKLEGENICDVGCGTGNLILNYLEIIGKDEAQKLIEDGKIYLFDKDNIALEICKYSIAIIYGEDMLKSIHAKKCDFLSNKIKLPKNCKVISNPPYYKIKEIQKDWESTKVLNNSKELYSCFMEKIIKNSVASVIITPYSFIGCGKFYSLRQELNNYNGFIVSFDNVPGNIFSGRKYGIFNSNKGNSVRAAITVVENKKNKKGFRLSPLIRFKTNERENLLDCDILEKMINPRYQYITPKDRSYYKCHEDLLDVFDTWKAVSNKKLGDLITSNNNKKSICIPTTCRYFTVGAQKMLNRNGKRIIYIEDDEKYDYVYCLINSSFAYWYWRLYDGGINCPLTILSSIPVFYDKLSEKDRRDIHRIAMRMYKDESKYLVYKMNAGKLQENIKFPIKYRKEINKIFLRVFESNYEETIFNKVHSSSIFNDCEVEENE